MSSKLLLSLAAFALATGPALAKEPTGGSLLFAHSPGCSHCAYQRPIVDRFGAAHQDVGLTKAIHSSLTPAQQQLIAGTSGHPVMVFHAGRCKRQVVGETAFAELEKEYQTFKRDCLIANAPAETKTVGSGVICR